MLQYCRQDHRKSFWILENLIRSYRLLNKILRNPQQFQTRCYSILDKKLRIQLRYIQVHIEQVNAKRRLKKDPMETLSNLERILQDIRQDPTQSYKILQTFYGILISSGKDPTVLQTRLYESLEDLPVSQIFL